MIEPNREDGSFYELSTEILSAAFPDASINWLAAQASTADRTQTKRERMRQMATQRLVLRVEDILVGVGLAQAGNNHAGGRTMISPYVISVAEKPMRLTIRTLPGQMPKDFAVQAERIAYNLDVAEVHVDELGPSLIQLRLVPKIRRSGG